MSKKMLFTLLVSLCAALFVGLFIFKQSVEAPDQRINSQTIQSLQINNQEFQVLLADDNQERIQGLSGRSSLANNQAMLFVFDEPGKWGIWMKDMLFSIDIVWLDSEKKVVHIEQNVSPQTYPTIFEPTQDSLYVIELNAGTVDMLGLQTGDFVQTHATD